MNTTEQRPVRFTFEHMGEVIINHGIVEAKGRRVVALAIDMTTKRPEVIATSIDGDGKSPGVILTGEHALNIEERKRGEPTHITFPEYPGWIVHCADVARYSLKICLIKPSP
jgi:hypothetical protein